MSEIQDHVSNLSQSIGPRPAGTEEEQQAALYIAEVLQKEAGLPADIEDFNFNPNYEVVRAACCAVAVVMALLAVFLPVMVIPSAIVALVAAVLFALEVLGKPVVSRLFNQGISQNVVAKYQPEPSKEGQSARRRKVVLVARYDSGKVRRDLGKPILAALPIIRWAELGCMVALPVLTLIRFFAPASGAATVVLNVLVIMAAIVAILPFVGFLVRRLAPYNEAANCNAAGVAVMAEVATRLGRGRVDVDDDSQSAVIHGEQAARASGWVPEGSELVYEAPVNEPSFAEESPEARLLAAKAAVAALSGKPVSNTINIDISSQLVQVKEPPLSGATPESMLERREQTHAAFAQRGASSEDMGEMEEYAGDEASSNMSSVAPSSGVPNGVVGSLAVMQQAASIEGGSSYAGHGEEKDVPEWFKRAQKKAKKTAPEQPSPSQRSRYAGALDAAEREIAAQAQNAQRQASISEAEQRLLQVRSNILQAQPPHFEEPEMQEVAEANMAAEAQCDEVRVSSEDPSTSALAPEPASTADHSAASEALSASPAFAEPVPSPAPAPVSVSAPEQAPASDPASAAAIPHSTVAFSPVDLDLEELRREMKEQQQAVRDEGLAFESLYASPSTPATPSSPAPSAPSDGSSSEVAIQKPADDAQDSRMRASIAASIPSIAAVGVEAITDNNTPAHFATNEGASSSTSKRTDSESSQGNAPKQVESGTAAQSAAARKKPTPRKKRSIALPSLTGSFAPIEDHRKQDAPLAQDAELSSGRSSLLRRSVPSVGAQAEQGGSNRGAKESLRAVLPSLSGIIREQNHQTGSEDDNGSAIGAASNAGSATAAGAYRESGRNAFDSRAAIPSVSLNAANAANADETIAINVNQAGAFASVGATGAFAPVGDELLDDVDPQDVYVDDADDSAYEEQLTETGAFAGPGYVEMPKSRASRFFGRFRSKKKQERQETTTQEWLDVDDEFDARSVGKARGGWESFRQESTSAVSSRAAAPINVQAEDISDDYNAYDAYDGYSDADSYDYGYEDEYDDGYEAGYDNGDYGYDEPYETDSEYEVTVNDQPPGQMHARHGRNWNGGAFSRESLTRVLGKRKKGSSAADEAREYDELSEPGDFGEDGFLDEAYGESAGEYEARGGYAEAGTGESSRAAEGGQLPREEAQSSDQGPFYDNASSPFDMDDVHAENIQRIYGFRHANVTTEVWFVALGAELASNAGMEAFIREHSDDLRGAIIIDLDSLGAGDLSLIDREGTYRSVKGSSRMKRYVRKASVALGVEVDSATMAWADSASACAMRQGYQAMHLAGMREGKPAYFGEADDVQANVSEETMLSNADFVMEVLKNV